MIGRRRDPSISIGVAGFIAVAGNFGGVAVLKDLPSSYRLARLDAWVDEVFAHPFAASLSGVAFTVGLVALAIWALGTFGTSRRPFVRAGALVIALGAALNAAGTLATVVVGYHLGGPADGGRAVARALLGLSLSLDAAFNVALGIGLILGALGWSDRDGPSWMRVLAGVAGVASLPVGGQAVYDPAASWLAVAGPLWLLFITASSVSIVRGGAARAQAAPVPSEARRPVGPKSRGAEA